MTSKYHMVTPSDFIVHGMSGPDEDAIWERYVKVMGRTRQQLDEQGYRTKYIQKGIGARKNVTQVDKKS